jgi:ABC-2 type transport system permease protein
MTRILALLSKELLDLRQNRGVFWPALLTGAIALVLPFIIAIVIPALAGERLSSSSDFEVAIEMYRAQPGARALDAEGAIQAFIFQQFLPLLVLAPVAASMSVAAFSVIGEKQGRTLEPLLATPITTFELLAAKVLGSLLPAIVLTIVIFALYLIGIAMFARPGASWILLAPRSLGVVFVLGPLAALAALQLAVCVSSSVNDARSAQQIAGGVARRAAHRPDHAHRPPHPADIGSARRAQSAADGSGCHAVQSRVDPDALELTRVQVPHSLRSRATA